ncbi:MAG: ABC transporter ATP-binding protein [Coriobacteriia bacterium]|nr:ABC transporter ATP-binding protein [Coriobacteriia bacterium]
MSSETTNALLDIQDLHVSVGDREILRGVELTIHEGETHVLLGPNGGGKSTLLNTIVGMPGYRITKGRILFKGTDLADLEIDERSRLGIGIAFQRPPAVRGVKLHQMLEVAARGDLDENTVSELDEALHLGHMLERDVNMGFSGGEAKRSEMAQLLAQMPDLALFDEPESGVDLDNIAVVGGAMNALLKGEGRISERRRSGLIITHTGHILEFVNADVAHVLYNGRLACKGNPLDLIEEISSHGYDACVECKLCQTFS